MFVIYYELINLFPPAHCSTPFATTQNNKNKNKKNNKTIFIRTSKQEVQNLTFFKLKPSSKGKPLNPIGRGPFWPIVALSMCPKFKKKKKKTVPTDMYLRGRQLSLIIKNIILAGCVRLP